MKLGKLKYYACPKCFENFGYRTTPKIESLAVDLELNTGCPIEIAVECPHCPAFLLLHISRGSVQEFKAGLPQFEKPKGEVFCDLDLMDSNKEKVNQLNRQGNDHMKSGNIKTAFNAFQEAIDIRKHDPLSWYNLGVCQNASGKKQEAIECFRHALRFNDKMENAWNNLGMLLLEQQKLAEASLCFDKAIEANPDYPKSYLGKGNVYLIRGDKKNASCYYKQALKKDSNYQPVHLMLAQIDVMGKNLPEIG